MGGLVGGVMDTLTGAMIATMPGASVAASLPGLRMEGKYSSSGLLLDFADDAVTLDCGQAHVKSPYTVENGASALIVHVQNSDGPFDLVVSSDRTLRGSGSTTVNGSLVSGINGTDITFTPHSEMCQVGGYTSSVHCDRDSRHIKHDRGRVAPHNTPKGGPPLIRETAPPSQRKPSDPEWNR
jgi:hypothetical protein